MSDSKKTCQAEGCKYPRVPTEKYCPVHRARYIQQMRRARYLQTLDLQTIDGPMFPKTPES